LRASALPGDFFFQRKARPDSRKRKTRKKIPPRRLPHFRNRAPRRLVIIGKRWTNVLFYASEVLSMGRLSKLPNIGAALEKQLIEAGITTEEELKSVGSREAWLRILARDPSACLNRLCALEGAVQGVRWHNLDEATKESLKAFYHQHKG